MRVGSLYGLERACEIDKRKTEKRQTLKKKGTECTAESKCNTFFFLAFCYLAFCPISRLCFRGSLLVLTFACSLVSFVCVSFFLVCLACFSFCIIYRRI